MSLIFIEFAWWVYLTWIAVGVLTVTGGLALTRRIRPTWLRVLMRAAGVAMGVSPTALLSLPDICEGMAPLPAWHGVVMGFSEGNSFWIWTSVASIALSTFLLGSRV